AAGVAEAAGGDGGRSVGVEGGDGVVADPAGADRDGRQLDLDPAEDGDSEGGGVGWDGGGRGVGLDLAVDEDQSAFGGDATGGGVGVADGVGGGDEVVSDRGADDRGAGVGVLVGRRDPQPSADRFAFQIDEERAGQRQPGVGRVVADHAVL